MQIINDINCLVTEVSSDYLEHILQLLSSCPAEVLDLVKQSILQGGKALNTVVPQVTNVIIAALVEKSVEVSLDFVKVSTRHMCIYIVLVVVVGC